MSEEEKLLGLRVAVLCGGPGAEREVSLDSGEAVYNALCGEKFNVEKVVLPETGHEEAVGALDCQVAVMMLHGEFGEDGHAQAILEEKGVAYTGPDAKTCALAIDKDVTKALFRKHGVPTPDWIAVDSVGSVQRQLMKAGMSPPLVVKPNSRGSSVGVTILKDLAEIPAAVAKALSVDDRVLIEAFVPGRELTVGWLGGELLPAIELVPDGAFYDYHAKYKSDKTKYTCPAPMTDGEMASVRDVCDKVFKNVSVRDLSRVDIILGSSGPTVLEINTSPGFTSHSLVPLAAKVAGIPMGDLCRRLVAMAAARGGLI